jgi:hypothetical protein
MNRLANIVVVGILLCGASVWGASPVERVAQVNKLYGELLFAQARVACDAAIQAGDNSAKELALLFRLRGLIAASLADTKGALEAFKAWISVGADADLASKRHAPHIRKLFAEAKSGSIGKGIRLQHLPPAGEVRYDGQIALIGEVDGDNRKLVAFATLRYRWSGESAFKLQKLSLKRGQLSSFWSVDTMKRPADAAAFEYYLEAKDRFGNTVASVATATQPLRIVVQFAPQKLPPATKPMPSNTSVDAGMKNDAGMSSTLAQNVPPAVVVVPTGPTGNSTDEPPAIETPIYKKWWLWTVVGAVVVGAGLGVGLGLSGQGGDVLRTSATVVWK